MATADAPRKRGPRPAPMSALYHDIADRTTLRPRQIAQVFNILAELIRRDMKTGGPRVFVIPPGLVKVTLVKVPARKAQQGTNPFTKEPMVVKARSAHNALKVRPLKGLKDLA